MGNGLWKATDFGAHMAQCGYAIRSPCQSYTPINQRKRRTRRVVVAAEDSNEAILVADVPK